MSHNFFAILTRSSMLIQLCIIALALTACASKPTVYSDFDARHDFANDHKFTWVQTPPMLRSDGYVVSPLAEMRMTNAIKDELIVRGFAFVENQSDADFSVVYTMGARDKIEFNTGAPDYYQHRHDWGWGAYYFPYFVHFPFDSEWRYRDGYHAFIQGEIALDIFDAKTKQPIWHTRASKRLSQKDLDSNAKNAKDIAMQLLQHFPWRGCHVEASKQCKPFE